MTKLELKTCPFCGGKGKMVHIYEAVGIICTGNCLLRIRTAMYLDTKHMKKEERAIKVWNTRA